MAENYLRHAGETGDVLLISCLGDDTRGGLFTYDGRGIERVDRLSTTGLWAAGNRLLRILWGASDVGSSTDILDYDERGIRHYHRIDSISEPHDILWDREHIVVVSTLTNSIAWVSPAGEIVHRWYAPGEGDAWHLNSLLLQDGDLLVTAFGKFQQHRGWGDGTALGKGIVFNFRTGADLVTGLSCPHHPHFFDGGLVICNSATREVLDLHPATREVRRQLQVNGWTRGVAVCDDIFFVGESAHRADPTPGTHVSVAVVDRMPWTVLERLPLPCRDIYDLVLARPALVHGVYQGFRTNPQRVSEQDQFALFDQVGVQPLRL